MAQHRKRKKKRVRAGRVFLAALFFAALFIGCIYAAYKFMVDSSPYINATPTPGVNAVYTPLPSQSPVPSPSSSPRRSERAAEEDETEDETDTDEEDGNDRDEPESTRSSARGEVRYSAYEDDSYGFACPYPSDFSTGGAGSGDVCLSLYSGDGRAYQDIIAASETSGSPAMDMRDFLSEHPSAVIEGSSSGSDYYYVLINDGGMYIYRYQAYSAGTAKGFEFGYEESAADIYSGCPADIRADFTLY